VLSQKEIKPTEKEIKQIPPIRKKRQMCALHKEIRPLQQATNHKGQTCALTLLFCYRRQHLLQVFLSLYKPTRFSGVAPLIPLPFAKKLAPCAFISASTLSISLLTNVYPKGRLIPLYYISVLFQHFVENRLKTMDINMHFFFGIFGGFSVLSSKMVSSFAFILSVEVLSLGFWTNGSSVSLSLPTRKRYCYAPLLGPNVCIDIFDCIISPPKGY